MTGIRIIQLTRIQVQATHKARHKHIVVVAGAKLVVQGPQNLRRALLLPGHHAEQRMNHGHEHGRWYPFAADIANTEEQLAVPDVEVVQVSAHFQRRFQLAIYIGRKHLGEHLLLNIPCNRQFSAYSRLLGRCHPEFVLVPRVAVDHESEDSQTQQHKEDVLVPHLVHRPKDFVRLVHLNELPERLLFQLRFPDGKTRKIGLGHPPIQNFHYPENVLPGNARH